MYATVKRGHTAEARVAHATAESVGRLEQEEVVHSSDLQRVRSRHARHPASQNQHRRALLMHLHFCKFIKLHFNQIQYTKKSACTVRDHPNNCIRTDAGFCLLYFSGEALATLESRLTCGFNAVLVYEYEDFSLSFETFLVYLGYS